MSKAIRAVNNGASFEVVTTNDKDGKVSNAVTYESDKPLDEAKLGRAMSREWSDGAVASRRVLILTMLAGVFATHTLDGYKGKGDRSTGKLPPELKKSVRDAESIFVSELVKAGHMKLPEHKLGPEAALQGYLTKIRDDSHYSRVKNVVTRYFAFVGARSVTESGYLIPVPVMEEQIKAVLDVPAKDDSYKAALDTILARLQADKSPDPDDMRDCVNLAALLSATIAGIAKSQAEAAANLANKLADVDGSARATGQTMIERAQEAVQKAREKATA